MLVSCNCFNVGIRIHELCNENSDCAPEDRIDLDLDKERLSDTFFSSVNKDQLALASTEMCLDGSGKAEKLSAFVEKRVVNSWSINRCLLCETDVYASSILFPGRVCVNTCLILDDFEIMLRKNLPNYSRAYDIVIPLLNQKQEQNEEVLLPPILVHSVGQAITRHLRKERHETEQRIQAYAEAERSKFEKYKTKAKAEEAALLRVMAHKAFSSAPFSLLVNSSDNDSNSNDRPESLSTPLDDFYYDSGVPVSPVSLLSTGGPYSPNPTALVAGQQMPKVAESDWQAPTIDAGQFLDEQGFDGSQVQSLGEFIFMRTGCRFATHLDIQSSTICTKRKRHSGGKGRPPSLNDRWYKQQLHEVFSLDEQEDDVVMEPVIDSREQFDENYAADASSDSDSFQQINAVRIKTDAADEDVVRRKTSFLCRSLPVAIINNKAPVAPVSDDFIETKNDAAVFDEVPEPNCDSDNVNLVENMMALSRSLRPRDDPETLFGNRPNRRRFRSSVEPPAPPLDPIIFTKSFCGALEFVALVNITCCIWKMIKTSSAWENDRDKTGIPSSAIISDFLIYFQ
uniref:Uncharacterized protein n=1 Tax=Romanomermis culicivorax TaxID=13658 RepID=A0A915KWG5_ROMCU